MKKISKILFSVLSIVLVLTIMVVPVFADSVRDVEDGVTDYPLAWALLNWSGVSTRVASFDDYYENSIIDTQSFIIGDVFADDTPFADYSNIYADSTQQFINSPFVKYYHYNNHRGYYNALNSGDILSGAYSLVNQFSMPSLYYYDDANANEPLKNGIHLTYLVPMYCADALLQESCDYLDFTIHYSMQVLMDDEGQNAPFWYSVNDKHLTYTLGGSNSDPYTKRLENVTFKQSISGSVPEGFRLITMEFPLEDILNDYSSLGYEGFSNILLFRNLNFYLTFDYDSSILLSQLNNIGDMYYANNDITNWYYHSVVDNYVYGGRTNTELPLFSVTTDKPNLSSGNLYRALDIYSQVVSADVTIVNPVTIDGSLVGWLGRTVGEVLDVELFGTFSLSTILYVVFGAGLLFAIIKFFAGG